MNVIVTGSNGFIGRHVCEYLQKKGCYIIGIGRQNQSQSSVNEYVQCDLSTNEVENIYNRLKVKRVDAVIHLAADMRREPHTVEVVTANCGGTQRILEMCRINEIPTFIQLSSLPLIGKPIQHPITEQHPIKPPTVYHITKYTEELLAEYANYTFGLRTVSFRISAPVGIGMNSKTIFPTFINRAIRGEDIVILGKGLRKQTYIHVKDIAQALYQAINTKVQGVYNLSSNNLISNYDLAVECKKVLKSQSDIVFMDAPNSMDDYIWDVSLEKISLDMGYIPEVNIDTAILEMADYYLTLG